MDGQVQLVAILVVLAVAGFAAVLLLGAWTLGKAGAVTLMPIADRDVPQRPLDAIVSLEARGFVVAGAYALVAPRAPDAHVVLLVHSTRPMSARVWAGRRGAGTRPTVTLVSRVGGGRLATSTTRGSLHLSTALEQSVLFIGWDELVACHEHAVDVVAGYGVDVPMVDAADAMALFSQEWMEEAAVVRGMSLLARVAMGWAQLTGPATSPSVSSLADLADRLARPPFR